MKRIAYVAAVVASIFTMGSCYNDDAINEAIDGLEMRIDEIEQTLSLLNSDLDAIGKTVSALSSGAVIENVVSDDSGYTITLSNGEIFTLTNGRDGMNSEDAPVIGVAEDGGVYYWTLTSRGETDWLLDEDGNRVRVDGRDGSKGDKGDKGDSGPDGDKGDQGQKGDSGDQGEKGDKGQVGEDGSKGANGVTPVMGVDADGYWTVDLGNGPQRLTDGDGNPVKAVFEPGKSIFSSVTLNNGYLVLTLPNGTVLSLARYDNFNVSIADPITYVNAGETKRFALQLDNARTAIVIAQSNSSWRVGQDGMAVSLTAPMENNASTHDCDLTFIVVGENGNTKSVDYRFSIYEERLLTFEDADYRGTPASKNYWTSLIPEKQYGGSFYVNGNTYKWSDDNNTMLRHSFTTPYWNGGHAISNYISTNLNEGDYMHQLSVYNANGGHDGSSNFAVHFGYTDDSGFSMPGRTPGLAFSDGKERVIREMYVCVTTYLANCIKNGNGMTAACGPNDEIWVSASGYDSNGKFKKMIKFYLYKSKMIDGWTKWDLSSLGRVANVTFNMGGTSDNGYGFSQPAYFAYDDVNILY